MKIILWSLILFSVTCSSIAQLLLKTGMSRRPVVLAFAGGEAVPVVLSIADNLWILSGLALYFLGAVVWLFVLAKVEVSYAYPFVGLGFVLTLLLGKLVMGDNITLARALGTVLITAGVVMIARQ